ncbi:MAG: hypothetical protein BGO43_03000 [Gammaproteobacteria bacterium 39-13]|nr:hypothetical protein [Gammaproteobacteria bacterium]OJV85669.1 MAG: hypothetical protein BGO43_03000 [Gammaproteobacteria bacterium 39-13]
MQNNSMLVWWIPIITLLLILFPFKEESYRIYVPFLSIVGGFAIWLVISYLFFLKERKDAKLWGVVFLVVALFYNPFMIKLNAAIMVANLSHPIAILMNLVTAGVFLYNWWLFKFKEKKH